MKDRLPAYGMANRVKITQDDGNIVEGVLSYADGATQEGSAYNKANVLPDSICKALGLSVESEPKDMFGVLADCGELHVWRKKVVVADKIPAIPAGYTIGELVNLNLTVGIPIYYGKSGEWEYVTDVSSISVSDDGSVHFNNAKSFSISDGPIGYDISEVNILKGKYVRCTKLPEGWGSEGIEPSAPPSVGNVYYFPSDTAFIKKEFSTGVEHNGEVVNFFEIMATKYKEVTGYPYTPEIPAGTTTTYPVSTNPKAYQEGDDAKAAGYVVGETVSGLFRINRVYYSTTIHYANSVNVADDGTVTLAGQSGYGFSAEEDSYNNAKKLAGKFIVADYDHNYCKIPKGVVLFLPTNTTISFRQDVPGDGGYGIFFDRYQPVIGYAAIPAGTTIEYLGKLGDKARVQVVSYVGTGTYGSSNPNSLTFGFVPKAVFIVSAPFQSTYDMSAVIIPDTGMFAVLRTSTIGYESRVGGGSCVVVRNNKTITWHSDDTSIQLNQSGIKFTAVAIG